MEADGVDQEDEREQAENSRVDFDLQGVRVIIHPMIIWTPKRFIRELAKTLGSEKKRRTILCGRFAPDGRVDVAEFFENNGALALKLSCSYPGSPTRDDRIIQIWQKDGLDGLRARVEEVLRCEYPRVTIRDRGLLNYVERGWEIAERVEEIKQRVRNLGGELLPHTGTPTTAELVTAITGKLSSWQEPTILSSQLVGWFNELAGVKSAVGNWVSVRDALLGGGAIVKDPSGPPRGSTVRYKITIKSGQGAGPPLPSLDLVLTLERVLADINSATATLQGVASRIRNTADACRKRKK